MHHIFKMGRELPYTSSLTIITMIIPTHYLQNKNTEDDILEYYLQIQPQQWRINEWDIVMDTIESAADALWYLIWGNSSNSYLILFRWIEDAIFDIKIKSSEKCIKNSIRVLIDSNDLSNALLILREYRTKWSIIIILREEF